MKSTCNGHPNTHVHNKLQNVISYILNRKVHGACVMAIWFLTKSILFWTFMNVYLIRDHEGDKTTGMVIQRVCHEHLYSLTVLLQLLRDS